MFDPSFMRSKYQNELMDLFGRLVLATIIIIVIIFNNDVENDDYDCSHKLAKEERRSRENGFD